MNRPQRHSLNFAEENCLSDEMVEVLRQKHEDQRLQSSFEKWRPTIE